tara:strand:- start:1238 stop:1495 length:258 start_codon:yes stop_codon:yes gene_type:complete
MENLILTERQADSIEEFKKVLSLLLESGCTVPVEDLATQYTNLHGWQDTYVGTSGFEGMNVYHQEAFTNYLKNTFLSEEDKAKIK